MIKLLIACILFLHGACFSLAEEPLQLEQEYPFIAEVNSDNINIRSDSTVSAPVICTVNRNEYLEVISSRYDWYKIRLPKDAPSFINKDLVEAYDEETAKVTSNDVNIRLGPDTSAQILGKADKDTEITILREEGYWYRITPIKNSFGWIHKNFANKAVAKKLKLTKRNKIAKPDNIVIEGIIRPKTFTRIAKYKIISSSNQTYLLQGKDEELQVFKNREVRISGKTQDPAKTKYSIVEVEKIEVLD